MGEGITIDIGKVPENGLHKSGNNKYYYDDDGRVDVTLDTKPRCCPGYKTLTYRPSEAKINSIKESEKPIKIEKFPTDYGSVTVYYCSLDNTFKNPLLIQLGEDEYYKYDSGTWKKDTEANSNLQTALDKQNCLRNQAHKIDISQKSNYANTSYPCPSCNIQNVTVASYNANNDYSSYLHYLSGSCYISGFKEKAVEQSGITFTGRTSTVYVYWYPKDGEDSRPLLICLRDSDKWCQRESLDSINWTEVEASDKPSNYKEDPKILEYLKDILPTVTINVGQTGITYDGGETTYYIPSGGSEQIKVKREDVKPDGRSGEYTSFVHFVQGKPDFIVREIKHEGTTLSEISSNFILKSVTAFYSVKAPLGEKSLLMVLLEKKNGSPQNNYEYYSRDDNNTGWSVISGKTEKPDNTWLTQKLTEIKERLDAERRRPSEGNGSEHSYGVKSAQDSQDIAQLSAGVIAGIAIGVIGAVASVAALVWRRKVMVKAMPSL